MNKHTHILSLPNFRWLWLGQAISSLGDKFTEIAIPIFIYQLTDSAFQLGFAFIAQVIAGSLFGLLAGVLSDRWDRRRTMLGADVARAGLIAVLLIVPFLPLGLTGQLIIIYTVSFVASAVKQFFLPAKISAIPDLVGKEQLMAANALDQGTMHLISFVGFAVAGAVIAFVGVTTAFVVDCVTFLLSAVCIAMIRIPARQANHRPQESLKQGIVAGLRFTWSHPLLRLVAVLSLIVPLAIGGMQPLLLVFAHEALQVGDFGFGLIEAVFGLGIAAGVLIIGRYTATLDRGSLMIRGVIAIGAFFLVAVLIPVFFEGNIWVRFAIVLPFIFFNAFANGVVMLALRTIVQENTPQQMMGRVFNGVSAISNAAMVLGAASVGLADAVGVVPILAFWSIFTLVAGVSAAVWYASSRYARLAIAPTS